jgi:phage shock protein A
MLTGAAQLRAVIQAIKDSVAVLAEKIADLEGDLEALELRVEDLETPVDPG